MKKLICLLSVLSLCFAAEAQNSFFVPAESQSEICAVAGMYTSLNNGSGPDALLGVSYANYSLKGLGFRTGVQYCPEVANVDNWFGLPVSVSWRTPLNGSRRAVQRGLEGLGSYADDIRYGMNSNGNMRDAASSFLINLFSRAEFFAGLTPCWFAGDSEVRDVTYAMSGVDVLSYLEGPQVNSHFGLTADAGASISFRVWRFCLNLTPAFHYNLVNSVSDFNSRRSDPTENMRWFFSMSFGLSFML